MKIGGVRRLERGEPDLVAVGDPRRGARGIAVRDGRDMVRAQPAPALAERLLVAHRARHRPEVPAHQPIADRQEMLADDRQAGFGQPELDVGDAHVTADLYWDDRAFDAPAAPRLDRVL